MTNKTPVFPISQPQHYSDYGFDPQIHYYQVLEEARKHKTSRSSDALHFKLQKPISKDDSKKIKKTKKRWWKNPLHFFNWNHQPRTQPDNRIRPTRPISSPIYFTEYTTSASTTPYRSTSTPSSGPLDNTLMGSIPYFSLRELNMDQLHLRTPYLYGHLISYLFRYFYSFTVVTAFVYYFIMSVLTRGRVFLPSHISMKKINLVELTRLFTEHEDDGGRTGVMD